MGLSLLAKRYPRSRRRIHAVTECQAEDIVNLRLGQLTRLDGVKLNDERKALEAERKGLKEILGDEKVAEIYLGKTHAH